LVLKRIKPKGMVVGMKAGQVFAKSIADETTTVESGDLFIIYTDGITETMNRQQLEYGTDLLKEVVQKHAQGGVEVVLERIMDSVRQFRGGTVADDDLTLLALAVD
jgi:phosphoserine phosphatase RsbU/P